ncbi:MAG: hypothetical protein MI810_22550 [Flavobacteriales bacterium]|nr:hypothetical protein [Flavobacteriales bacterium]
MSEKTVHTLAVLCHKLSKSLAESDAASNHEPIRARFEQGMNGVAYPGDEIDVPLSGVKKKHLEEAKILWDEVKEQAATLREKATPLEKTVASKISSNYDRRPGDGVIQAVIYLTTGFNFRYDGKVTTFRNDDLAIKELTNSSDHVEKRVDYFEERIMQIKNQWVGCPIC